MARELLPCPKCGQPVTGRLGGGPAAYGCREWEYEVECSCGLLWSCSPGDVDEEEAIRRGIEAWNERFERTCHRVPGKMYYGERRPKCSECGYGLGDSRWSYCPSCGAKVVG